LEELLTEPPSEGDGLLVFMYTSGSARNVLYLATQVMGLFGAGMA